MDLFCMNPKVLKNKKLTASMISRMPLVGFGVVWVSFPNWRFCRCTRRDLRRFQLYSKTVDYDVIVVGGGIGGLALSAALKTVLRWSGSVLVIEQSTSESFETGSALGLWTNAFKCLDALGNQVGSHLRNKSCPLQGVVIRDAQRGQLLKYIPLDNCKGGPHEFYYVRRRDLVDTLCSLYLSSPDAEYLSGVTVENLRQDDCMIVDCSNGKSFKCRVVIGADGIGSVVRKYLYPCPRWPRKIRSNGYLACRGIVGSHQLPKRVCDELESHWSPYISQIWGKGIRVGVAPLDANHTCWYWFLTINENKCKDIYENKWQLSPQNISEWIVDWFYPIPQLIQNTRVEDIHIQQCADSLDVLLPRKYFANQTCLVTLLGDAAHPTTPNLAQGAALALEDALVLASHLYSATWTNNGKYGNKCDLA